MIDDSKLLSKILLQTSVTKTPTPSCALEDDEDDYEMVPPIKQSSFLCNDDYELEESLCDSVTKVTRPKMIQGVIVVNNVKYEQIVTSNECM